MISKSPEKKQDLDHLQETLKKNLKCEMRFDDLSRTIYSVDASIYELMPTGIIIPENKAELLTALKIASDLNCSITPRGAATGITGSCLGKGLVIDLSKFLNQILEINIEEEYVICEPGVVQDRLNDALSPFGYRLGPDTSTGNRATIGGMLANNSAGARSLKYGRMVDHILEVELLIYGGYQIHCVAINETEFNSKISENSLEGHIYREIFQIKEKYAEAITKYFPKIPRNASGYNLNSLLSPYPLNLSRLIAGSEGTLGIATKIKLRIAKKPIETGLCVIHVLDVKSALESIKEMLTHLPIALELIDDKILEMARLSPTVKTKLNWIIGNPKYVFVAEFEGNSKDSVSEKLSRFSSHMKTQRIGYAYTELQNAQEIENVWDVRKAGLGLLLSKRSYNRAIAFIEDVSVAPENLPSFLDEFNDYLKSIGKEAGIYGHIGSGCMHIRPYIDLRSPIETKLMRQIMDDVSTIVLKHHGSMSGEHGDGLIRSWLNEKMYGKDIYQAFCDLKKAFDPKNLMNPGKIVNGPPLTENLRLTPETRQLKIETFLNFNPEGGLELSADLCNGNGQCRKSEGVMCPSFQVSNDEYHSTRARAQSLRAIINGKLPSKTLTDKSIYDVMDLCIECKGCKKECPSQVDMAKMKAELLYQYQEKHGYFFRNRLFGNLSMFNRLASLFPRLFNQASKTKLSKSFLDLFGITSKRNLPDLALEKFSTWFKKQKQISSSKKVILFNDTYTEFNEPMIGKATFGILKSLGYQILLFQGSCCGRPLISKGLLKQAKVSAKKLIQSLFEFAQGDIPIIILEPSCHSSIYDDFKGFFAENEIEVLSQLELIRSKILTFDEFLCKLLVNGKLPLQFVSQHKKVFVHGHCHQKALIGTKAMIEVLKGIETFDLHEIKSGCCGLAGSFGYEKEHYDFSMEIGNLHLFPFIKKTAESSIILANGMSCRSQIRHGSNRSPQHLAEVVFNHLKA